MYRRITRYILEEKSEFAQSRWRAQVKDTISRARNPNQQLVANRMSRLVTFSSDISLCGP
jgi:hypothetical protein